MTAAGSKIRYLSVVISSEGIAEMDDETQAVFIPRQDIVQIELTRGSGAERPVVQTIAAVVLIFLGVVGVASIWEWIQYGGRLSKGPIGMMVFMGVGFWLLWNVLYQRTYLLITTKDDTRKVVFYGKIDPAELLEFLGDGQQELGQVIHIRSGSVTEVTENT